MIPFIVRVPLAGCNGRVRLRQSLEAGFDDTIYIHSIAIIDPDRAPPPYERIWVRMSSSGRTVTLNAMSICTFGTGTPSKVEVNFDALNAKLGSGPWGAEQAGLLIAGLIDFVHTVTAITAARKLPVPLICGPREDADLDVPSIGGWLELTGAYGR